MAFDGSNVSLTALTAPFPEGTVVADGRINRVLDDVLVRPTLTGTLDLAPLVAVDAAAGAGVRPGTFDGTMTGRSAATSCAPTFARRR